MSSEAIEAIVYDQHPALTLPPHYPYGRPVANSAKDAEPLGGLLDSVASGVQTVVDSVSGPPDYVVPKRFGMSAFWAS